MPEKVRVILITDGDQNACKVIELVAKQLRLRCISASGGNPTPIEGDRLVSLLKQTPYDPVLVMFDDRGDPGQGKGETAMEYICRHPDVTVLGVLAVASCVDAERGATVDFSIDRQARHTSFAVDKTGQINSRICQPLICGDTLDNLDSLDVPLVIGIGDIGKMGQADDISRGAPVTKHAIKEILKRSDLLNDRRTENRQRS